ncbi:Uncharacterised protein [Acetobacterium wieringae]|nr:Uncharacterised protein [Acetobacterium wieringae]
MNDWGLVKQSVLLQFVWNGTIVSFNGVVGKIISAFWQKNKPTGLIPVSMSKYDPDEIFILDAGFKHIDIKMIASYTVLIVHAQYLNLEVIGK